MLAARDAQVIRPTVVPPLIEMEVLAIGRHDGSRCVRGRATSENEGAGSAFALACHHQQVGGKRLQG